MFLLLCLCWYKDERVSCSSRCRNKHTAYVVSASTGLFHFQIYNKSRVVCERNSVTFRATHYGLLLSLWGYQGLRNTLFGYTTHHDDRAHMITIEMFTKVFYILGCDLTPFREAGKHHVSIRCSQKLCIVARFEKPLPGYVTTILRAEFPGNVEIHNSRNGTVELISYKSDKIQLNT